MDDFYKILGVNEDADVNDIKKKYRQLAKELHPDKGGNEEEFKKVTSAYETLSDPAKRQEYDLKRKHPGGHFQSGFDPNSIFDEFVKRFNYGGFSNQTSQTQRGNDVRINLTLTLEECAHGVSKKIKYNRSVHCSTCQGSGAKNKNSYSKCNNCNGHGFTSEISQNIFGGLSRQIIPCSHCSGKGKVIHDPCKDCTGHGIVSKEETIDINIPAGVVSEMAFRLEDKGNYIQGSNLPGAMLIVIVELEHDKFTRIENDIYYDLFISIPDAIFGNDSVPVPTLDGLVMIKIDPGSENGKILRLGGKGVPNMDKSHPAGDMYIYVNIYIPKDLSPEDKKYFNKIKANSAFAVTDEKTLNSRGIFKRIKEFSHLKNN